MSKLDTALATLDGYWQFLCATVTCLAPRVAKASATGQHLALVVWEFPPSIAGGVYRPAALARYASRAGLDVSVVAGPGPHGVSEAGANLRAYVGDAVRVHRIAPLRGEPSYFWFPQVDGGLRASLALFWRARSALRDNPPDVIVATGPPFADFVAGYLLSCYFRCKLVLDFRDEWTECPFDFVAKGRTDTLWERRCIERADKVVFTTESQRVWLVQKYGSALGRKSLVISNGWEPAVAVAPAPPEPGPAIILFAGKLGGHTDPAPFLAALKTLIDQRPGLQGALIVRFLGLKTNHAERLLREFSYPQVVEDCPSVPLPEAVRLMAQADALLLLHDPRFERYLPGKLYEYLASGTPILLFNDDGESGRLVESLGAGWKMVEHDVAKLGQVVDAVLAAAGARGAEVRRDASVREAWLDVHTREHVSARFIEEIRREFP